MGGRKPEQISLPCPKHDGCVYPSFFSSYASEREGEKVRLQYHDEQLSATFIKVWITETASSDVPEIVVCLVTLEGNFGNWVRRIINSLPSLTAVTTTL